MAASSWTPSPLSAARPASLWNINMTRNIISRDSRRHGNTKYYPAGPGDAPVAAYILLLAEAHGLYTHSMKHCRDKLLPRRVTSFPPRRFGR